MANIANLLLLLPLLATFNKLNILPRGGFARERESERKREKERERERKREKARERERKREKVRESERKREKERGIEKESPKEKEKSRHV